MTQKIKLDFILTAQSTGLQQEIGRLNSQLNAMAKSAKGPQAVNVALREQMTLHQANINAIKGHSAAISTLASVSQRFSKNLATGNVSMSQSASAMRNLVTGAQGYSKEIKSVAREQLRFQNAGFTSFMKGMNGQLTGVLHTTDQFSQKLLTTTQRTKLLRMQQALAATQVEAFGSKMVKAGKNMQWTGRQITMGFTLPLVLMGGALAKTAAEVDKQLTRISKVYNFTTNNIEAESARLRVDAVQTARFVAEQYGFAADVTLGVMAEFAQQGRRGLELIQLSGEAMRLAFLGDVDTDNATRLIRTLESAADIANGINIRPAMNEMIDGVENGTRSFQDLNDVLNRFNYLENNTVITVADLAEELPDLIGTLNSLNLSVEFGAAALTGMKEAGLNVNESQTALRVGLQRLISPSKKASETFQELTGKSLDSLAAGSGSAEEALIGLADELRKLDSFNEKADLLSAIFGNRQAGRMSLLIDQIGEVGSSFEKAINITGGFGGAEGVDRIEAYRTALAETERVQDSLSGKLERAKSTFGAFSASLGESFLPTATSIVEIGTKVVKFFDSMPGIIKKGIVGTIIFGGAIGLLTQVFGTLYNLLGTITQRFGTFVKTGLRLAGHEVRMFATAEEAMQTKMLESTSAMQAQQQQVVQLQRAMSAAQGYTVAGSYVAAESTANAIAQQKSKLAMQTVRIEQKGLDVRIKATAESLKQSQLLATEHQRRVDLIRKEEAGLARQIAKSNEKLSLKQQELAQHVAIRQEALKELRAKKAIAQVDERAAKARYNLLRAGGANVTQDDKLKAKAQAEIASIKARRAEAEHTAMLGKKAGIEKQITGMKKEQAALDQRRLVLEQTRANVQAQVAKISAGDLAMEKRINLYMSQKAFNAQKLVDLERMIGVEKARALEIERKKMLLSSTEIKQTAAELAAERKVTQEKLKQERLEKRMAQQRSSSMRKRGIGSGAAFGVGMAAQAIIPDDNVAGGMLAAGMSGLMTGGMIGGTPGIVIGAITALVQMAGPLKQFAENIGLIGEEAESAVEKTKSLAEALELPFNLNPFEGTLDGGNSLTAQMEFESTDFGKQFVEDFEGNDQALSRYLADVIPTMLFGGLTAEEIIANVQPALNAAGSELDLTSYMFNADGSRESINEFASQVNLMLAEDIADNGEVTGRGLARSFEMAINAVRTNNGEYAKAAIEEFFGGSGIMDLAESAGNSLGATFTDATQQIINDRMLQSSTIGSAISDLNQRLQELYFTASQDNTPEQARYIQEQIDATVAAINELGTASESSADGMGTLFQDIQSNAHAAMNVITEFADSMDIEIPPELTEIPEIFGEIAKQLLGPEVASEYESQLQRLALQNSRLEVSVQASEGELVEQAFALAMLASQTDATAESIKQLTEEQQALLDSFMSGYRGAVEEAYNEVGDMLVQPVRDAMEARSTYFDGLLDQQQDAASDQKEALSEQQQEESRIFGNGQSERMEILTDSLEAELEAYDEQTDELKDAAEDAADAKIAALEAEAEAIDEADKARERAFEAEKRRQDYYIGLRNSSVSLAVALATGDIEAATEIQGQMQSDTSDYLNASVADSMERKREEENAKREESIELIEKERDLELESIEERREAERDRLESAHELRVEQLEEVQRLETKALDDRHKAESDALSDRLDAERDALQERKENEREAGQARIDAAQKALEYAIEVVNPTTAEGWSEVVNVMNNKLVDLTDDESFVSAITQAGLDGNEILDRELAAGVASAVQKIQNDEAWAELGATAGDAIARGMFADLPINGLSDLFGWFNGGASGGLDPYKTGSNGVPTAVTRHSGGTIGAALPKGKGLQDNERPIIAQTGEYMLQRSAVSRLGVPFLEQLNSGNMGKTDGLRYHGGGLIEGIAASVAMPVLGMIRAMGDRAGAGLTAEGYAGFSQRFGAAGGTGGGGSMEEFMAVIRQQESGGRYNITNPIGAHGAYQFMPGTWAGAVVPALGRYVNLYSSSPSDQDTVARHLMTQYYEEMQNWQAVAAAWYGGPGRGRLWNSNPNHPYFDRPQGGYPSVREYIQSITSKMGVGAAPGASGFGPFNGMGGGLPGQSDGHYTPGQPTGYGNGPTGPGRGNIVDVGRAILGLPQPFGGGGVRVSEHPAFGGVRYRHAAGGHHYSNASGTGGDALDINAGPGGMNAIETRWMDEIFIPWANANIVNAAQILWRVPGHFNHAHIGGGNTALRGMRLPQMMTGGSVQYDNTIANLHAGETVLTKPLTEKLERGIDQISNSSTMNIFPSPGMDERALAAHVIRRMEEVSKLRGRRSSV